jgi:glycosyltransferase involved in cell wall biosynthesis
MAKNDKADVTVVITTYNHPERIKKAINTVLQQTIKNIEIILVDGANSQMNKEEVEKFNDNKISYISVEPDAVNLPSYSGIQHARNVGCGKANGKYIAMLDDDDIWAKDKLEKQLKIFSNDYLGTIGIVLTYSEIHNQGMVIVDEIKQRPTYSDLLKSFNLSQTSAFLIRKDMLSKIGYWNEKLRGMHEYDIALRMAKEGFEIVTVPEPLTIINEFSDNQQHEFQSYHTKIEELFDFWYYYGKDFIPYIGFKGFVTNVIRTVSLFSLFTFGYFLKDRIWKIISPLNIFYRRAING